MNTDATRRTPPVDGAPAFALTSDMRKRFARIADELVPPHEKMPAPSEIDISGKQLDAVLASRPDLRADLVRVLARPDEIAAAVELMDEMKRTDPAGHEAVTLAVIGGYYMHDEVKRRLGYPGQTSQPVAANLFPAYVDEGLLDPLVERGSIYRDDATR